MRLADRFFEKNAGHEAHVKKAHKVSRSMPAGTGPGGLGSPPGTRPLRLENGCLPHGKSPVSDTWQRFICRSHFLCSDQNSTLDPTDRVRFVRRKFGNPNRSRQSVRRNRCRHHRRRLSLALHPELEARNQGDRNTGPRRSSKLHRRSNQGWAPHYTSSRPRHILGLRKSRRTAPSRRHSRTCPAFLLVCRRCSPQSK